MNTLYPHPRHWFGEMAQAMAYMLVGALVTGMILEARPTPKTESNIAAQEQTPEPMCDGMRDRLIYLKGHSHGFGLCSDINKGVVASPEEALARQDREEKEFLESVKHVKP